MIEYFSMAMGFYVGTLIVQYRSREGLYVSDLFLFAVFAFLWPAVLLFTLLAWLGSQNWMNIKIRW